MKRILFILALTSSFFVHSQEKFLGKVMDANKKPIVNAKIFVDGKPTDIVTNTRGYFEVELPEKTKVISVLSEKYGLLSAEYTDQKALSFMYMNQKHNPEGKTAFVDTDADKVSIGYTKVDQENSAFGTTNVDVTKQKNTQAFASIFDLIRARLKGVRVTRNNKIIIRGVNSISSSSDPLFVVNGQIVQDISYILPIEVKKVNVLKGAAASIYGTRASNGVIEITLKS